MEKRRSVDATVGAASSYCSVAQLEEQFLHTERVADSNSAIATKLMGPLSSWLGHQLVTLEITGSNPVGPVTLD